MNQPHQSQASPDPWPEIQPLASIDESEFPVDALPPALRKYVEELAEAQQTPVAVPALVTLGCASACVARRYVVSPRTGWEEPVNLYVLVAQESGSRKSPVFRAATKPLREFEDAEAARLASSIARSRAEREHLEDSLKALKRKRDVDLDELASLRQELDEFEEVRPPRLLADDVTLEMLPRLLQENGERLAVMSSEGDLFSILGGRYTDRRSPPNLGVVLQAYSGDPVSVDRIGREGSRLRAPALTIVLTVQPITLREFVGNRSFLERGLVSRFLCVMPESSVGTRRTGSAVKPMTANTEAAYGELLREILSNAGRVEDPPVVLRLSPAGSEAFEVFEQWCEEQLDVDGKFSEIRDWGSKLVGQLLRIIGLLHLASAPGVRSTEVSLETVRSAERIVMYCAHQAAFVLAVAGVDPVRGGAQAILRWLRQKSLSQFSVRDGHQGNRCAFEDVKAVERSLELLTTHGYVRLLATEQERLGQPGRPPSPRYEVNPAFTERDEGDLAA